MPEPGRSTGGGKNYASIEHLFGNVSNVRRGARVGLVYQYDNPRRPAALLDAPKEAPAPMMKCLVQCRYEFRGLKPTRELVRGALRQFLRSGTTPANITLQPVCWSGHSPERIQECIRSAGARTTDCPGVVRYYARPELVLMDFDSDEPVTIPTIRGVIVRLHLKVRAIEYHRTRRGWHVVLLLKQQLKPAETVALQAILGSDPLRETFNLARILGGQADESFRWNLLFDYKLRR